MVVKFPLMLICPIVVLLPNLVFAGSAQSVAQSVAQNVAQNVADDKSATIKIQERQMSQYNKTQQERMLMLLAKWRSEVTPRPDPKYMETLVWNDELAALAQAQADRCTYDPGYPDWADTLSILSTHPGRRIGFTHWTGWNSSWATHYWNKEGDWFDYCNNKCTYDRAKMKSLGYYRSSMVYYFYGCVNYTQLIWADSKYVGCGHRVCGFKNYGFEPGNDHHVCFFFPGAIVEFEESERMKTLPYKTQQPLAVACGADSTARLGRIFAASSSLTMFLTIISTTIFTLIKSTE